MNPDFSDLVDGVFDEGMLNQFYAELKLEFRHHPSMDLEMIFRSTIKKTQGACCLLLKRIEALNKCKPMADIVGGQGQKIEGVGS